MQRTILPYLISLALVVAAANAQSQHPRLRDEDRIRIAEAFGLADSIQDSLWDGWSGVPFVLLLVTSEHEFLFRHPYPSEDFSSLGYDDQLASEIHVRPNTGHCTEMWQLNYPFPYEDAGVGRSFESYKTALEAALAALADFEPYAASARSLGQQHAEEMAALELATWQRTVFYPVGASEGLLLDKRNPGWKAKYFADPFFVERYH